MTTTAGHPPLPDPDAPAAPADPAVLQEASAWVGQLLRTIKTCRLYDEANPTVVRFREDLATSLIAYLTRRGSLRLEITSKTLMIGEQPVHVAKSRDDNLGGTLHRDGIRALAFEPGIEPKEIDALVDQILRVTGPSAGDDDLVTLLWDADLPHVIVETVPIDGDADGGLEDDVSASSPVSWPKQERGGERAAHEATADSSLSRSDDWSTQDRPADLDVAFDELEGIALFEIARFQEEQNASLEQDVVMESLRLLTDCCASPLTPADAAALAEFTPRVLREALARGDWGMSGRALRILRGCSPEWSVAEFSEGLCGPFALTTRKVVAALDQQDQNGVESFLTLGREFGPPLAQWLLHVLAESRQMRVRRRLAKVIAEMLGDHPDGVTSWLSDERWYVVRNAVHILGWIGGPGMAERLRPIANHPEPRVRREVVAALSQVDHDTSRPILLDMLQTADAELFTTILHQLTMDSHASITGEFLEQLRRPTFAARSPDERRALFMALATRGDAVLPALDAELNRGGLFSTAVRDEDRQAIALCIARIGTPSARGILDRGRASNVGAVRKACLIAGAARDPSND